MKRLLLVMAVRFEEVICRETGLYVTSDRELFSQARQRGATSLLFLLLNLFGAWISSNQSFARNPAPLTFGGFF